MIEVNRPERWSRCVSCNDSIASKFHVGHIEVKFGNLMCITLCKNCSDDMRTQLESTKWYEQVGNYVVPIEEGKQ